MTVMRRKARRERREKEKERKNYNSIIQVLQSMCLDTRLLWDESGS